MNSTDNKAGDHAAITGQLSAYMDNELSPQRAMEIEAHLEACPECQAQYEALLEVKHTVEQQGITAPAGLEARIIQSLRLQETRAQGPGVRPAWSPQWLPQWLPMWGGPAIASGLMSGLAGACLTLMIVSQGIRPGLTDELVSSHVRALMPGHLVDVVSSDHHTVKPWFADKLDFSPPVLTTVDGACQLLGGRLDYIDHHDTAAMAYQCRKHLLNLYVHTTEQGEAAPKIVSERGFHVVSWRHDNLAYYAVSDMDAALVQQFARDVSAQTGLNSGSAAAVSNP